MKINKEQLNSILEKHQKWIDGIGGEQAVFPDNTEFLDLYEYDCFPAYCVFGNNIFKYDDEIEKTSFGDYCVFGDGNVFYRKITFGNFCEFGSNNLFRMQMDFGEGCVFGSFNVFLVSHTFGEKCEFGDYCTFQQSDFGKGCVFGFDSGFDACLYNNKPIICLPDERFKTIHQTVYYIVDTDTIKHLTYEGDLSGYKTYIENRFIDIGCDTMQRNIYLANIKYMEELKSLY